MDNHCKPGISKRRAHVKYSIDCGFLSTGGIAYSQVLSLAAQSASGVIFTEATWGLHENFQAPVVAIFRK
jgi:hypothetical protein